MKSIVRSMGLVALAGALALALRVGPASAGPTTAVDEPQPTIIPLGVQYYYVQNFSARTFPLPKGQCFQVDVFADFNDNACAFFKGYAFPNDAGLQSNCTIVGTGVDNGGAFTSRILNEPTKAPMLTLGNGIVVQGDNGNRCRLKVLNRSAGGADALVCVTTGAPSLLVPSP